MNIGGVAIIETLKATVTRTTLEVWTKHRVGHGLPYGLLVVNFVKARLSITVDLCKQRAQSVCHIYGNRSQLTPLIARYNAPDITPPTVEI